MSVPAWKQAVIERRKKQEEEERKKQEQEEQYLSSLPPWKRAIILRNREKSVASGGGTQKPPASSGAANKSTSSSTKPSVQKPTSKQSTKPNQWQAAVEISIASSPTRQRPPWARTSSPNLNSPRRTRSNLWEKQNTSSNSVAVPTRRVQSFNITADKQPVSTTALNLLQQRRGSVISDQEESSPQNKAKFNSQVKASPFQSNASSSMKTAPSNESVQLRKKEQSSVNNRESIEEKRRSFENETILSTAEKRLSFEKDAANPATTTTANDAEDPALANMPAWKKAIILRRRQQQAASSQEKKEVPQPKENQEKINTPKKVTHSMPTVGVDETDSPANDDKSTAVPPSVQESPTKKSSSKKSTKSQAKKAAKSTTGSTGKQDSKGTKRVKKAESKPKPEVVNREPADSGSGKLVTQEGVTLHPPVYKEVEQWANVLETDEKFLSLPTWKQAMIKRRRADIAKRSVQNVPAEEKKPKTSAEPVKPVHTAWSPRNSVDIQNDTSGPNWKQEKLRKRKATPPPSKIIPEEKIITGTPTSSSVQSLLGRFGGTQPARTAPSNKPTTDNKQNQQQQHRAFNVGDGESSDSELEDVVVTCIDEEDTSDEDDSGIDKGTAMRSRSVPTTPTAVSPTSTLTRSSSKSILAEPGKKSYTVCPINTLTCTHLHTHMHTNTHTYAHPHTHKTIETETSVFQ